jgi:hypothetical protein
MVLLDDIVSNGSERNVSNYLQVEYGAQIPYFFPALGPAAVLLLPAPAAVPPDR